MPEYTYLIVGAGMTADAAVHGIREVDSTGSIGIIGAESHPPYNRPPLSKGLWKGNSLESIWCKSAHPSPQLYLGRTSHILDPHNRRVIDDLGTIYSYSKLLLATGGTPRRLPFGGDDIIYFRTFDDYQRLRMLTERGQQFAVIGGGFIGSEVAAALAMNGKKVTMFFPEAGIGARVFPASLAQFLNDYYRKKNVEVRAGEQVVGMDKSGNKCVLRTHDPLSGSGEEITVDGVVAGIGITPNVELAQQAGLPVDNGIIVDAALRSSDPNIYAAGDVAAFRNPALDCRLRVEHEDNALTMGRLAGQSMAGQDVFYDHLPSFYTDLFDLGCEAVGEVDSRLETVLDWKEPYREGVIYYLRDGRVRGVLLWNVWGQVEAARKLIAEVGPFHPADLKCRLPT